MCKLGTLAFGWVELLHFSKEDRNCCSPEKLLSTFYSSGIANQPDQQPVTSLAEVVSVSRKDHISS